MQTIHFGDSVEVEVGKGRLSPSSSIEFLSKSLKLFKYFKYNFPYFIEKDRLSNKVKLINLVKKLKKVDK